MEVSSIVLGSEVTCVVVGTFKNTYVKLLKYLVHECLAYA